MDKIKITTYYGDTHDTWYLTRLDSTHLNISLTETESRADYHIEQLSHQPYYEDIKLWLKQPNTYSKDINGKQYQTLNLN